MSSPPGRVTAEFTEPVVDESRLDVYDPCGSQVDGGDSFVAADRITVSMSADKQGTYTVRFSVISAVDSHPTNGEFTFVSAGGDPCPGAEPEEKEPSSDGDQGGEDPRSGGDAGENTGGPDAASVSDRADSGSGADDNDRVASASNRSAKNSREDAPADRRTEVASTRLENPGIDLAPSAISANDVASIWAGIPMVAFIVAMLVAAIIGGAGGLIYAGIAGPKR